MHSRLELQEKSIIIAIGRKLQFNPLCFLLLWGGKRCENVNSKRKMNLKEFCCENYAICIYGVVIKIVNFQFSLNFSEC